MLLYQVGENDHGQRSTRSSAQALGTANLAAFTAEARDNHPARGADVSEGDRADSDLVIGRSKQLFLDLTRDLGNWWWGEHCFESL